MNIKLDEKDIFTFDSKTNAIGIHRHTKARYTGPIENIGEIEFFDLEQAVHFAEMIHLMVIK